MSENKVKALQAEYGDLQRERDGAFRATEWFKNDFKRVSQELDLAKAQLWSLRMAQANSIPQSGYRLAYVAG
jgi:hypothetical protein